ncbi:DUF4307 domain-containing protein [Streptomyces aidingensis]|uniref:DUF4307 domain-containing protein n=1 Tax=Streptomyces aidingensis TaxID=910347 RepID=A0A1I1ELZ7_9ACTN|nr:DUF4307 domain-containing protein [Streptomyces aidingensis]SFB88105.1 protein of unknown function [Streptomyces aidingensis]
MPTAQQQPPHGRYGRPAGTAARTDRRLKAVGAALGALLTAGLAWAGWAHVTGNPVSGELTGFQVLSDTEVEASIQVRKPAGTVALCTVRSQAVDGLEVGRAEFRFEDDADQVHRAVTLKTIGRATTAELLGCTAAPD